MASRNYESDLKTPAAGLVQLDLRVACLASGSGVDTANSDIPAGHCTVARTGVGIYTITLTDGFYDVCDIGVTLANNGTYLPAFQAQPAGYPPYKPTVQTAGSTLLIHVGNATVLADPAVTFALHITIILRNKSVAP